MRVYNMAYTDYGITIIERIPQIMKNIINDVDNEK